MANNNISLKHNLLKLNGATVMNIKGKAGDVECLVIPIEMASLFKGQSGVYLDSTAMPLTSPKADSKDTHLIKQSFGKEKFAAMTDEQKKAIPIMGNAIVWGGESSTPAASSTPSTPPSWL